MKSFHSIEQQGAEEQGAGMESPQILVEIIEDKKDPLSRMESCHATTPIVSFAEDVQSSEILSTSSNMENIPSNLKVISETKDENSSRVLESLQTGEITKAEDEQSGGIESFQKSTEIIEDKDPLSGPKPYHSIASSVPTAEVNPFMKDLPKDDEDIDAFYEHLKKLKKHLKDNMQMETMSKFFDVNDMTGVQQKVEESFNLCDAIELLIKRKKKKTVNEREYPKLYEEHYFRIDIYCNLFKCAFKYKTTEFMVFLINKFQREKEIEIPSLVPEMVNLMDKRKTSLKKKEITNCIRMYEEETISVFICHVLKDEKREAEKLFKCLIDTIEPNDFLNRGRLYNYALQRAANLFEVHKILTSDRLSQRYRNAVQGINQLNWTAKKNPNQLKVHEFLLNQFYLRDVEEMPDVMQNINWNFVEKNEFPYLVKCVLEHCKRMQRIDTLENNWEKVKRSVEYAFTSSVAIGEIDMIRNLLQICPELDVNVSYESVTALHIATYEGNEEMVKYLLDEGKLDINARTGRLKVEKEKASKKNRWNLPAYQTALHIAMTRGHEELVIILGDPSKQHEGGMRYHEADEKGCTPLDILYTVGKDFENFAEIEKILLSKKDVQSGIDRLYRNRQVLVDSVNTILVGAALIASVTFAGWLQPPLGYAQYYDLAVPYPAPSGTYESYIAVRGNLGIKAFALFNSLSFFFAIATIIVAADAAFPSLRYKYIGHIIQTMELLLQRAIKFLIISLVCVLGAFSSAAIVILPPSLFFRKDLVLTIIIGSSVCCVVLWQLLSRHSERVETLNNHIKFFIRGSIGRTKIF